MVTRAPAEQNPAVDPELPQPPTTTPGPPVTDPEPLSPLQTGDVNPFGPVVNVDLTRQPEPVPAVAPGADSPFGGVFFNDATARAPTPVAPGATSPFGGVFFNDATARAPTPVAPGATSPFGGAVFNDATARAPTPVAPGATSPFGGAFFNDATARTPTPVDPTVDPAVAPGATSPFGGGAFNRAAAQNPEAVEAALQAAQEAQLRQQAAVQAEFQSPGNNDWRVKLKLASGATYLYKDADAKNGILAPLAASNGVVFPYMPTISTSYNANYDQTDLTHSNYRGQFYKSSYVGDIQISGEFTAQDTAEANYLLAVIHFFRSVTKMFYGAKDAFRGTPPPLVYLMGLGQYQFNNQPCVVRTFNYSMPNNVDYIRTKPNNYNVNLNGRQEKTQTGLNPIAAVIDRLRNAGLKKGALPNVPSQTLLDLQSVNNIDNSTYVPTRCDISITLMPIQTRDQQSTLFNMKEYASGQLLKGGFW
jgi:hypothetical protein